MRRYTQSGSRNCWQTAIACILEVPPDTLPSQMMLASDSYGAALNAYLHHHHELLYFELCEYQLSAVSVRPPGWHVMVGPTKHTREGGIRHAVVGRYGLYEWDPYPLGCGLIAVERWGILAPLTHEIKAWRNTRVMQKDPEFSCVCPACLRQSLASGHTSSRVYGTRYAKHSVILGTPDIPIEFAEE